MINSDKLLERIEKMSPAIKVFAKAKADRVYLDEFRKSLKAILIGEAKDNGAKTAQERESYAYSHKRYIAHLTALREAIEIEEKHKWSLERLKMDLEVWRSLNANKRHQESKL